MTLEHLSQAWLNAKEAERVATDVRRDLEDQMAEALAFSEQTEGTTTAKLDGFTIKITGRIDRKVDSEKLQELAAEAGLTEHLGSLFRWKPEIKESAWKAADEAITRPLAGAITAKPGRPSFSIIPATKE